MKKMPRFAVVLSGCGRADGSEIHEAVTALLAIDCAGCAYRCFAPDIEQAAVINNLTSEKMEERRNVLVESARIARGDIKPLNELNVGDFDCIVFPGGLGAVTNWCDFADKGINCTVESSVSRVLEDAYKNKLVIDQTVAPVIQSIFSMKMDGFSPAQIADKLNKDGVPSPYEYKRQSGSKYQSGFKKQIQTDWGAKAIYRILKNEMYTGTLVQGKTTTPNHKIKSRTTKDEADWMRTENAHDAIISPSIFDMVQKLMLEDTRSPSGDNSVHLFSGKVFCADCQSTMTRKKTKSAGKEYVYFVCNANKVDRKVCDAHTVKEQVVYDAALAVIQAQVSLALNLEIALGKLNGISWERREMERIASKIARQEEVVEHNKQMKAHVYEDFKTELITREEYFIFKAEFDKNIQEAKEAIARLVGNKNQISSGLTEQQSWLAQFKEYENIQELNRRVVVNFIDRIEITEDKQVHVVLNNADQFQAIMEFLEEEKAKANAKKVISFIREVS